MTSLRAAIIGLLWLATGCESSHPVAASRPADLRESTTPSSPSPGRHPRAVDQADAPDDEPLPTISLGATPTTKVATAPAGSTETSTRAVVIAALQPLQTVLGKWRGTTRKAVGDFKGVDDPVWVWDLRTNRDQPALVMKSSKALYFQSARLTWLTDSGKYRLEATSSDGQTRLFEGAFTAPVEEFQDAGSTVQRRFKLQFDEITDNAERWQLVMNVQNNDRYLLELSKAQGSRFSRFDTVGHQRDGTSFAQSDTDYGERKCIISGGLGTIQVAYEGRTYWVCCTGCEAAFKEDPEGWLKEAAKKE